MIDQIKDNIVLEKHKIIVFITVMTSIFLNHSNKDFGINVSLADIFILLSISILIAKKKFVLPNYATMFFMLLSITLIITSIFYSPIKFNFTMDLSGVIKDYMKVFASFLFFLLGYNMSRLNILEVNIKWYSIGAFIISSTGLIFKIFNINILNNLMYYGGSRFRGLMIDPNYYSVIQCTAMVYFLRQENVPKIKKALIYVLNFVFIAMSGSKTGMLTLIIYSLFIFFEYQLVLKKTSFKSIAISLAIVIVLTLSSPVLLDLINMFLNGIPELLPIFKRVQLLFTNFSSAIAQGGSGRNTTWISAIGIIKESPLIGVGLGSYITINNIMFGSDAVAHNTYLQIFSEWGGLLATIFFGYIFIILAKITLNAKKYKINSELLYTRDIVIILLIGSMAISLNNARMLWMFLGGLIYYYNSKN